MTVQQFVNMRATYLFTIILTLFICSDGMMCFCGRTLKVKKKLCQGSPTKSSQCPFGTNIVPDACGCCRECSKMEGERCGGMMSAMGKCSNGLVCSCRQSTYTGYCRTPKTCDTVFKNGPRGFLNPSFDSRHEKCNYKLIAPSDQVVHLVIYKVSGFGYAQPGGTCATKLQIVDHTDNSRRQITNVCENQEGGFPIRFTSSSRRLDVVFVQDERGCGYNGPFDMDAGYRATYEFIPNGRENGSGFDNQLLIP